MVQFQRHALREAPGIRKSGNPLTSLLSSMSPEKAAASIKEYQDGEHPWNQAESSFMALREGAAITC